MIGLKRGTVRLAKHSAAWSRSFAIEAKKLKKIFGNETVDIQHIGSTAIPSIRAKPIVDICVAVRSLKRARSYRQKLKSIGYAMKEGDNRPERLFFTKGPESKRTHYLHIGKAGNGYIEEMILFRDYLRKHRAVAMEYDKLKQRLLKLHANNRARYTKLKEKLIKMILLEAESS